MILQTGVRFFVGFTPDNMEYVHPYNSHMCCYMGVNVVILYGCVILFAPQNVAGCTYRYTIWVLYGRTDGCAYKYPIWVLYGHEYGCTY